LGFVVSSDELQLLDISMKRWKAVRLTIRSKEKNGKLSSRVTVIRNSNKKDLVLPPLPRVLGLSQARVDGFELF
jgi:hypothetical protein